MKLKYNNSEACQAWKHDQWAGVVEGVSADINRYLNRSEEERARGSGFVRQLSTGLMPEILCLSLYRISHFLHARGWRGIARMLSSMNYLLHGIRLPAASCIGPGCRLSHPAGVVFEGSAGSNLTLFSYAICISSGTAAEKEWKAPQLGNHVSLGAHSVSSGNIEIGDSVHLAPGASVHNNIKSHTTVVSTKIFTRLQQDKSKGSTQECSTVIEQ